MRTQSKPTVDIRMKTHEVLSSSEAQLTAQLRDMKIKELERHSKKILVTLGQPDFDAVMSAVIKALPEMDQEQADRFSAVQELIKATLPAASNDSPLDDKLIERLAIIIVVLITKKFQKIHRERG